MSKRKTSHLKVASYGSLAIGMMLASQPLRAQETVPQAQPVANQPVAEEADGVGAAIVVTGTRLSPTGFTAPTPVTVLDEDLLQQQGATNIADALNALPAFRPQSTPATAAIFLSNVGANLADLRGLGAQRTLVLVNGRRFVPSTVSGSTSFAPAGTVDLNMIPTVLIDRAEVVTGGASAVYGSDAVAGVVNLILDTDLAGIKASVQAGISDEGDGEEFFATGAYGTAFADGRGHFVIGAEYANNKGVGDCYERDWCAEEFGPVANPRPQVNGLARQLILPNMRPSHASWGGLITSGPLAGTEFLQDGTTVPHDYGTFYGAPIFQSGGSIDPEHAFYNNFPLVAPVERVSSLAQVSYEFSDDLEAFVEGSYGEVWASTIASAPRLFLGTAPVIQRQNPYIPDAVAARMDAQGVTSFVLGRIGNDIGPPVGKVNRSTWRVATGLEGSFANGAIKWDAYYQYGKTDYSSRLRNSLISGNSAIPGSRNFYNAVDAVRDPATGQIVCRITLTDPQLAVDPMTGPCQPLNLFGENNFSPEAKAYVTGTAAQDTQVTQHVAALNVQSELFDLPGGPLAVGAGVEYRVDDVEGMADPISAALRFLYQPATSITGPSTKVKEGYVEFAAPILSDKPFARELSLNGAVRLTDYSTSGTVTTWKLGAVWEPVEFLRLRATRSRDIRAPNFFELYNPQVTSFQFLFDPERNGESTLTSVLLGGNAALQPEVADTWTVGAVISPLTGLRFSVDYFDINVEGAVGTLGGQVIVNRCSAGVTEFCQFVERNATGALARVENALLNVNEQITRGIDFEASYRTYVADGDLTFRALATHMLDLTTIDFTGTAVDRAGMNGSPVSFPSGVPDWTVNASVDFAAGPFELGARARWISSGLYNVELIGPHQTGYDPTLPNSVNDNFVDDVWYFDLNAAVNLIDNGKDRLQLFGAINNLFDKDPPNDIPSSFGVTNPVLYDVVGRYFRIGLRFTH